MYLYAITNFAAAADYIVKMSVRVFFGIDWRKTCGEPTWFVKCSWYTWFFNEKSSPRTDLETSIVQHVP